MNPARVSRALIICCGVLLAIGAQNGAAANLCVNHSGSGGCYTRIATAVNHAGANDVIHVAAGTYKEDVVIGKPLSLIGAGSGASVIDATGLANGIFIDGYSHPGLSHVTVAGFTVKNAQWEGILVVSASWVTIRDSNISYDDLAGPIFTGNPGGCAGQPAFETDESGDCGGAVHLIGISNSVISGNVMEHSADAVLISDETGESHDNLITKNTMNDNPLDCGLVLASHPPVSAAAPPFAAHYGIDRNTISENIVTNNGVQVEGSGVGLFSDGNGQGKVSGNVIIGNLLSGNGIGGVAMHSHVGPAFGLPSDDMNGNIIVGNYVFGNGQDVGDTATPGTVGIQISSGGGGTPIEGTIVAANVIWDEDYDVAVDTPGKVTIELNDLFPSGMKVGVGNICAYDMAPCTGSADASQNYWGCKGGPGAPGCSTATGPSVQTFPWLKSAVGGLP
ncbi:MAG TPA: right-handed parallel beta-helix repeat-containing protein [Acidobacteriaceae bacterium]|jgi:nitrous oxidase accessory protein NosD|nr:right-handed parallel beta-helix repeat-containing protein [Acidobacteriaceae bacterium]